MDTYSEFIDFSLYTKCCFVGVVTEYQRSNGTTDFGVFIIRQSRTTKELVRLIRTANLYRMSKCGLKANDFYKDRLTKKNISYIENVLIPKMEKTLVRLDTDERLINFGMPLYQMKRYFSAILEDLKTDLKFFSNVAICSRKVRRIKRGSTSPLRGMIPSSNLSSVSGFG